VAFRDQRESRNATEGVPYRIPQLKNSPARGSCALAILAFVPIPGIFATHRVTTGSSEKHNLATEPDLDSNELLAGFLCFGLVE
jgi:hypothetical protein